MAAPFVSVMLSALAALGRRLSRLRPRTGLGRRGGVAIMFAAAAVPLVIATGAAVDLGRVAAGRSALQRAVDSAALSGAAAYVLYTQGDTYNALARNMGLIAFCDATATVPSGFTVAAVSGGGACGTAQGAAVSAVIGGFRLGTRGLAASSGCTATNTVVAGGVTCGFIVTVQASATMTTIFPLILGRTATVSVSASAVNPFINLAVALQASFGGSARYADSLWVYPLLLNANGAPDFVTNSGALPSTASCTGIPTQTSCGSYTMLASTLYVACTSATPCTVNGTVFGGSGGVVQNPAVGNAVVTATTPLGFALESSGGAPNSYGYYGTAAPNGCRWATSIAYNTLSQIYDTSNNAVLVDASGNWTLPTHWFYSSYLKNSLPPSQGEIALQLNTATNPATGLAYNIQDEPSVPNTSTGVAVPATCANASNPTNHRYTTTTYPATGNTNCSLYILQDPSSLTPNPAYKVGYGQTPSCFTPANTPGYQYSALSCQSFTGHNYVFFWNDMGGGTFDDTDYGNGIMQVACAGASHVLLIN